MSLLERFEQKYIPEPNSGCWLWLGASLGSRGKPTYGLLRGKGRTWILAHRVSCDLFKGGVPAGMCALHKCDNPCCVNPEHLFFGTRSDNHADMVRKGRNGAARGEASGMAKLTANDIREIRASTEVSRKLAKRFGVNHTTILNIRRRSLWRHVQ